MIDYVYKILAKILINYSYAFGFVWKKKKKKDIVSVRK